MVYRGVSAVPVLIATLTLWCLGITHVESAQAQAYSTCIEDGGQAQCTDPTPGASIYSTADDPHGNVTNVGFTSEQQLYDAIVQSFAYACTFQMDAPPYSWTLVNIGNDGTAVFNYIANAVATQGNPCTVPVYYYGTFKLVKQETTSCPKNWSFFARSTANHPLGY
jgi:hypothetical protein